MQLAGWGLGPGPGTVIAQAPCQPLLREIEKPALEFFHQVFQPECRVGLQQAIPPRRQTDRVGWRILERVNQCIQRSNQAGLMPFCNQFRRPAGQIPIAPGLLSQALGSQKSDRCIGIRCRER